MKSNLKAKIIIFLALGIIFALSATITSSLKYDMIKSDESNFDSECLKFSAVSGKININGNSGWANAKTAGICTGNGTYSAPYVIEDLIIDGGGSGNCIWIGNSDVYFKLENCTVFNSGYYGPGIRLSRVSNGTMFNNTVNGYSEVGIDLYYSNNNNLSENTANNNRWGIYLRGSDNNTISGNTAINNDRGIILTYGSNNNTISGNTVNNNQMGIEVSSGDNNMISGNIANNNRWGISIEHNSGNNTISGNLMNECGLRNSRTSNKIDTTNLVNGKPLYYYTNEVNLGPNNFTDAGQVILVNCNDSLVSNLNVSYGSAGISLSYCYNNTISGNTANNNHWPGISLSGDNNIVSGNTANNNTYGLNLGSGDNNNISGNTANYNSWWGIGLSSCDYNTVTGNTANYNDGEVGFSYGIHLSNSEYNNVSGNIANNNRYGIQLYGGSNHNTISGNTANYNLNGIQLYDGSNYNTISGNVLIGNDECIVESNDCVGNIFNNNGECAYGIIPIGIIVILISVISGGAVIVATGILIRTKRRSKDEVARYYIEEQREQGAQLRDDLELDDK